MSILTVRRYPARTSTAFSVILIILGLLAIFLPFLAGLAIAVIAGWLILFAGVVYLIHAFDYRGGASVWRVLLGILYVVGGAYLLLHPGLSLLTLTLWLAVLFFIEGIFELIAYFSARASSGWVLFNAIVTLFLAFLIWRHWPSSAGWAIGTIVGVNLLFSGISRLGHRQAQTRVAIV